MSTVIKVESLSKQYRLGKIGTGTLGHDLNRWWHTVRGKEDPYLKIGEVNDRTIKGGSEYVWALRDLSFDVGQGDVVGIIGRNGAGKSTLLKILSRTTSPTSGTVKVRGRIASLLEVGTGFHPELTGRENIFLNGAILGMRRKEIARNFDEIVDFSGVEKYIDTPVKRYSSGMYVRLAFAVAAHLEPEILIVDEVLAVGDTEFQKKALGKMQRISSSEGRTVLFVSHNMQAISTLTKSCIFLNNGNVVKTGTTKDVIETYLTFGISSDLIYEAKPSSEHPTITRVEVKTTDPSNTQLNGESIEFHFQITTSQPIPTAALSFQICNSSHVPIVHLWLFDSEQNFSREPGVHNLVCRIPKFRLYMGHYTLTVHLGQFVNGKKLDTVQEICPFEVVMFGKDRQYNWQSGTCAYLEECNWEVTKHEVHR